MAKNRTLYLNNRNFFGNQRPLGLVSSLGVNVLGPLYLL
jgi:hypothetical protein